MAEHTFTIQTTLFKTVTKTEEVNNSTTCYLWDNEVIPYKLGQSIEFQLKLDLYQYTNKSLPNEEYLINGIGTTKYVFNTEYSLYKHYNEILDKRILEELVK